MSKNLTNNTYTVNIKEHKELDAYKVLGFISYLQKDFLTKTKKEPDYLVISKNLLCALDPEKLFDNEFETILGMKIIKADKDNVIFVGSNVYGEL